MGNPNSGASRSFLFFLMAAFVISAALSMLSFAFNRIFLSPVTYKDALSSQGFYARVPGIVAGQITYTINYDPCSLNPLQCRNTNQQMLDCADKALGNRRFQILSTPNKRPSPAEKQKLLSCETRFQPDLQTSTNTAQAPLLFRSIKTADMEKVIGSAVPANALQAQSEQTIDSFFAYLNGTQDSFQIPLVTLKRALSTPAAMQAVLGIIRAQPPCTLEQLQNMLIVSITGKGELVLCRPSDTLLDVLAPIIQLQQNAVVSLFPDTLNLHPFGKAPALVTRILRLSLLLTPELPLFCLILITLAAVRSLKELLRWWGAPLFFTGVVTLILGGLSALLFEWGWWNLIVTRISLRVSDGIVGLLHDLTRVLLTDSVGVILTGGCIFLAAGGIMWLISSLMERHPEKLQEV